MRIKLLMNFVTRTLPMPDRMISSRKPVKKGACVCLITTHMVLLNDLTLSKSSYGANRQRFEI